MKKIATAFLTFALLFSLAGCGNPDSPSADSRPVQSATSGAAAEDSEDSTKSGESMAPSENTEPEDVAESIEASDPAVEETESGTNILIAYFSWSGNTRQVAQEIEKQTGGDLFELVLVEPYPEDYNETGERWHREHDEDARPELAVSVDNMEDYGIIFLGYPIWSSTLPSPNRTFLEQYDFSGKTIIPFCTHGGSRFGSSISVIEELAPGAVLKDGYETSGNSAGGCADEVAQWLQELGIAE